MKDANDCYEGSFKIALIGDGATGKSCFIWRFVRDSYEDRYLGGYKTDNCVVRLDKKIHNLQLVESNNPASPSSRQESIHGSHAALIFFDLTDRHSFASAKEHLNYWDKYGRKPVKRILIGTKTDLSDRFVVSEDEIKEFAKKSNIEYYPVSSKTGDGVDDVIYRCVASL